MLELRFSHLHTDGPTVADYDKLLRIVARFELATDNQVLYDEEDLPVVELAQQLQVWLEKRDPRPDFTYDSMESATPGLVRFLRKDNGWLVGSAMRRTSAVVKPEELEKAVRLYNAAVMASCRAKLGVNVGQLVHGSTKNG